MSKRILALSIFPAPYRTYLINYIKQEFEVDDYYERDFDSNRSNSWFVENMKILTNPIVKKEFDDKIRNISLYDGVILYDYTSPTAIKIIRKPKHQKLLQEDVSNPLS